MAIRIITTGDGSHSLLNEELNETYHSVHGAVRESEHVFIQHGLDHFLKTSSSKTISVLEVGFGTGLNALLTIQYAHQHKQHIQYTTLEAFPLEKTIWGELNYTNSDESKQLFTDLHGARWNEAIEIDSLFTLTKLHSTLEVVELQDSNVEVVYFDAFAPSKQPDLWTLGMLAKIINVLKRGGVFVTYCAKGQLKRDLKGLGCEVETLPGPPGKKEMVRATKAV